MKFTDSGLRILNLAYVRKLSITYEISDDISESQTLLSDSNLRFPLFDYYLQHWLIQKSFSVSGRHVVYYCPDICGLIVGEPIGGHLKGPAKRMADDDVRFAESFEKMIRKALDKGEYYAKY